jgi:hypothetical protein
MYYTAIVETKNGKKSEVSVMVFYSPDGEIQRHAQALLDSDYGPDKGKVLVVFSGEPDIRINNVNILRQKFTTDVPYTPHDVPE